MVINLLSVSVEEITMYVNLGSLALLAIGLLGFLFGLFKGVWKKTFSFIYFLVSFLLLIFFTKSIAKGIYSYDIYSLTTQFGLQIEGLSESNSSIGEFLRYHINSILEKNSIIANNSLYFYVDGLVLSIIQFVIFLVGIFAIYLLSFILCPLLYHLVFKWIVPKRVRKHTKLRVLGGLIGFVESILVFCLLLSPFSALLNTVVLRLRNDEGKIVKNEESNSEVYDTIMDVIDGYNNSILGKALFTVTINGKPFDVALMDYVTESNLNEKDKVNLYHEFGGIGSILVDAFSSGAINLSDATLDITTLIESAFVKNTFYTLAESSLITVALPIALSIAMSNIDINVDLSSIDLSEVDWADTTRCIGDVFDAIKNTGYIQSAIQDPSNFVNNVKINRENEVYLKDAISRLGNSSLITTLMPQVIVSFLNSGKNQGNEVSLKKDSKGQMIDPAIFNDFPEQAFDVETYKNIQWGNELSDMLEIVFMILDQYQSIDGSEIYLTQLANVLNPSILMESLLGLNDNNDYSTDEVYKNNVYLNGGTVNEVSIYGTKSIFGCGSNKNVRGILDLQIIDTLFVKLNMMPKFVSLILDFAGDDYIENKDEVVDNLEQEVTTWTIEDWKVEFASLLELSVPLLKTVENVSSSSDALTGLTTEESNVALNYFSDNMEDSYLMSKLAPLVAQSYVNNPDNDSDLLFGLRMSDLNFVEFSEGKSFCSEFDLLVNDFLPKAKNVAKYSSEGVGLDTVVDDNEELKEALKSMKKCEITNKNLSQEEIDNGATTNFEDIMINIFCEPTQEELENGFDTSTNIPTLTDNLMVFDRNSVLSIKDDWVKEDGSGELDNIFIFFDSLKDDESETNYIYDYFCGSENVNMATDIYSMGPEIERVFSTVDASVLVKESFPDTLDQIMADTAFASSTDFDLVENWEDEGVAYNKLLTNIDNLRGNDKDKDVMEVIKDCDTNIIKEYQFDTVEYRYMYNLYNGDYYEYFLNESKAYPLLKDMYETQSISMQDILYDTLKDVLSPEGAIDPIVDSETFASSREDFDFIEETISYKLLNTFNHFVSWELKQYSVDDLEYYGEIFNFARLLGYSSVLDRVSSLEVDELNDVLVICVKSYPMRKLVGPIVEDTMLDMKTTSSQLVKNIVDACDFDAFKRLVNPKCRLNEIDVRMIEVDGIIEVRTQKATLDYLEGYFDYTVEMMTTIDEESDESDLTRLLNKMHRTELYNSIEFISSKNGNNDRDMLTSFEVTIKEIFRVNPNAFRELLNDEVYELNNRGTSDLWIKNGSDKGEIYNFNLALNNLVQSDVYVKVISARPNDSYSTLKKLYNGGKTNHIEELSNNLCLSILLEKQLSNIYDKHIYNSLKKAVVKNNINSPYKLANDTFLEYEKIENIDWNKEGCIIDDIYLLMGYRKVDISNLSKFDSLATIELLDIVSQSEILSYDSSYYDLDKSLSKNVERSFKEYLIYSFN